MRYGFLKTWLYLPVVLAMAAAPALADEAGGAKSPFSSPEEEQKLRRAMEALTGGTPSGAHRPKDPHLALGPEKLIRVALQHLDEGRPDHAVTTLSDALKRFPGDGGILLVRGSLLLQQGKTADALRDLEQAARATPDKAAIYVNRAQAYRRFERDREALADLDRAIELDPDSIAARFNRGSMHFNAGRFEKALADFERCIAIDPHAAPPYFNLAATREQLGDKAGAAADLKRFLELAKAEEWRKLAEKKLAELVKPAAKTKE